MTCEASCRVRRMPCSWGHRQLGTLTASLLQQVHSTGTKLCLHPTQRLFSSLATFQLCCKEHAQKTNTTETVNKNIRKAASQLTLMSDNPSFGVSSTRTYWSPVIPTVRASPKLDSGIKLSLLSTSMVSLFVNWRHCCDIMVHQLVHIHGQEVTRWQCQRSDITIPVLEVQVTSVLVAAGEQLAAVATSQVAATLALTAVP